jgi:hypothetical protein
MKRRRAEAEEKRGEAEEIIDDKYPVPSFISFCKNCCKSPVFKYRRLVSVKS